MNPTARTTPTLATLLIGCTLAAMPAGLSQASQPDVAASQPGPTRGSRVLPDSPAGRRVAAFIDAINDGDAASYERFAQDHRTPAARERGTPERRAQQYAQFKSQWGGLDVDRVFEEPGQVVVYARTRTQDEMLMFTFLVDPADEHRIDALRIEPGGSPDLHGIESSPAWTDWDSLPDFLQAVRESTGVPAVAAAVVKDGRVVASATVGVARADNSTPVDADARFHWGSLTKALTATAIATLVERGDLSWDTTVAQALPGLDHGAYAGVTLRHLLSHTAGVPQYTLIVGDTARRMSAYTGTPVEKRHQFIVDLLQEPALFEPGEASAYSNAGYGLAAHMAETVTGIAWEDLVRTAVFEPLGMTTAGLGDPSTLGGDQPVGHAGMGPEFRPMPGGMPNLPGIWPAGNAHSNIEDLATFAAFHLAGLRGELTPEHARVLSPETIAFLHEPAPGTTGPQNPGGYALGWLMEPWPVGDAPADRASPPTMSHAHNGSAGTFYATMRLLPDQNAAIVTLMNAGQPGDMLAPKIERAITNHFFTP